MKEKEVKKTKKVRKEEPKEEVKQVVEEVEEKIEPTEKPEVKEVKTVPQPKTNVSKSASVENIIVQYEDEISFVIDAIQDSPSKRLAISIPMGSDILMSGVGMKLIAQCADAAGKEVVIVTDDKLGEKMAALADLVVEPSTSSITENSWERSIESRRIRIQKGKLPQVKSSERIEMKENLEANVEREEIEPEDAQVQESPKFVNAVNAGDQEDIEAESQELEEPMDLGRDRADGDMAAVVASGLKTVKKGAFEMTIDDTPVGDGISPRDPMHDIDDDNKSFVGRDFSDFHAPIIKSRKQSQQGPVKPAPVFNAANMGKKDGSSKLAGIGGAISGFFKKIKFPKDATGKIGPKLVKLLIPVAVAAVVVCAFIYWYLPEVVVSLKVESIPVDYTGEVTAAITAESANIDAALIPAKVETVKRSGSENADATGTASRGETASGNVTIYNKTSDDITVASGTVLSNGGLEFVLQADVAVPKRPDPIGMGSASGSVVAAAIGTDYNIVAGTELTVGTYALGEMSATNPTAFTGGTKEDYKIVTQEDIDKLADKIKERLYTEAKDELSRKNQNSKWVFIETSIQNKVDGDVKPDVAAGSERTSFNVSLDTISTALYYDSNSMDELIQQKLLASLDDSSNLNGLTLANDIDKEITIKSASVEQGNVILSVVVSGFVMPQLDATSIEHSLQGLSWTESLKSLRQIDYLTGDPSVDFYPSWFPNFAKRMPSRKGRITVNIENVAPTEPQQATNDDAAGTEETGETTTPAE